MKWVYNNKQPLLYRQNFEECYYQLFQKRPKDPQESRYQILDYYISKAIMEDRDAYGRFEHKLSNADRNNINRIIDRLEHLTQESPED